MGEVMNSRYYRLIRTINNEIQEVESLLTGVIVFIFTDGEIIGIKQ